MLTNLMNTAPDAAASKATGPNRYPPQPEGPPSDRFATLLQQRQHLQPQSQPQMQPQPPAKASPPEPESGSAPKTSLPPEAEGSTRAGADSAKANGSGNAIESAATPQASTDATRLKARPGGSTLPPEIPLEKPIADTLPPQAVEEVLTASANANPPGDLPIGIGKPGTSADDAHADDNTALTPDVPVAAPPFWPGMPHTAGLVPAGRATDALASAGGSESRAGPGANPTLSALAIGRGEASESSAGGQGGNGGGAEDNAKDGHAAALLAAATQTDADKALKPPGDRFALPPRVSPQIETSPSFIGHVSGIAARGAEAGAAASAALSTPLHAPDFAKALGAQVSLFARNGLAQAELQLNPTDMGPIRVQIAIEGAHARVDFAADAAATRQVIERGLPELATALREQGLTLSGGGVFQRAPDQRGDADTPAAGATRGAARRVGAPVAADGVAPAAQARAIAALRGGVDLYA